MLGSSPLARGLRNSRPGQVISHRIIPARAGFTQARASAPTWVTDHPRSRGVYRRPRHRVLLQEGSSPLARGLLAELDLIICDDRIIPARAGFTQPVPTVGFFGEDHPRSRGVYLPTPPEASTPAGSSPLARGLPISILAIHA